MTGPTPHSVAELKDFFSHLDLQLAEHLVQKREQDRKSAPYFSVLRFMQVDENLLSDMLAFLLDPNESHGQRELFLKLFVKHIGWQKNAAWGDASVAREARTFAIAAHRRRIDILITAPNVSLAIENKTGTEDSEGQILDYLTHLKKTCDGDFCLIFLTPDGKPPERLAATEEEALRAVGSLRLLSYARDIRAWLTDCQKECDAESVRLLLRNLATHIETHLT